jgi:hypothetical protein
MITDLAERSTIFVGIAASWKWWYRGEEDDCGSELSPQDSLAVTDEAYRRT